MKTYLNVTVTVTESLPPSQNLSWEIACYDIHYVHVCVLLLLLSLLYKKTLIGAIPMVTMAQTVKGGELAQYAHSQHGSHTFTHTL